MILVNGKRVAPIELDKSFGYLDKELNFYMNIDKIKELIETNLSYIITIDKLPLSSSVLCTQQIQMVVLRLHPKMAKRKHKQPNWEIYAKMVSASCERKHT